MWQYQCHKHISLYIYFCKLSNITLHEKMFFKKITEVVHHLCNVDISNE